MGLQIRHINKDRIIRWVRMRFILDLGMREISISKPCPSGKRLGKLEVRCVRISTLLHYSYCLASADIDALTDRHKLKVFEKTFEWYAIEVQNQEGKK